MTSNVNEYYGVTVWGLEHGRSGWTAKASIFRRDTQDVVETCGGEGRTQSSAQRAALNEARTRILSMASPEEWLGAVHADDDEHSPA